MKFPEVLIKNISLTQRQLITSFLYQFLPWGDLQIYGDIY